MVQNISISVYHTARRFATVFWLARPTNLGDSFVENRLSSRLWSGNVGLKHSFCPGAFPARFLSGKKQDETRKGSLADPPRFWKIGEQRPASPIFSLFPAPAPLLPFSGCLFRTILFPKCQWAKKFAFFEIFLFLGIAFWGEKVYYIPVDALERADIAQPVERILGKDEVPSSNLGISSKPRKPWFIKARGVFLLLSFAYNSQDRFLSNPHLYPHG